MAETSNQDFATFLRTQRHRRKLSQAELARRAQISERTLRYWETGDSSPGRWELESILTTLELTAQERIQALMLLPNPRNITLSRQTNQSSSLLTADLGPMPGLGDLLQAMRLRRGLSQGQVAADLKISRSTVLRWETAETLPTEENLERICVLLKAYPEERLALSDRRLQMWAGSSSLSLEACGEQVTAFDRLASSLQTPLIDLYALALKRQLWPLASQSTEAWRLLARVQVVHSNWLDTQDRKKEAAVCIQRSLNSLRGHIASEPFWQATVNIAAQYANEAGGGNAASLRLLKQWLPAFPRELQATLLCDMALYAGRAQQPQMAAAYLATARDVLPHSLEVQGMTEHYYPLTCARVLLSAGRPAEALEWLPPIPDATWPAMSRIAYQLLWAEALVEAKEGDAAQRHLDHVNTLLVQSSQPRFQRKLNTLAARL